MMYAFYLINTDKRQSALAQINQAERFTQGFQSQFVIDRYKYLINGEISGQRSEGKGKNQDILAEIAFQDQINVMIEFIKKNALLYMNLWELLIEELPNLVKLQDYGQRISQDVMNINTEWLKLNNIGGNMQRVTHIYSKYILEVVNDKFQGQQLILQGIEMQQLKQKLDDQLVITQNEDIGKEPQPTIIITTETEKFEQIIGLNQSAIGFFKHNKGDLLNKQVDKLMPNLYEGKHTQFVKNICHGAKWKEQGVIEKYVYAKDKFGYIMPTYIQTFPVVTLSQTLEFIGIFKQEVFFKKIGLIITDKKGYMKNISPGCIQVLQFSQDQLEQKDDEEEEENLKNNQKGFQFKLDKKQSYFQGNDKDFIYNKGVHIDEILPDLFANKEEYQTKLGKLIDYQPKSSKIIGPVNYLPCQINLCVIPQQFSDSDRIQGYIFKLEQINDIDNSEVQEQILKEKQSKLQQMHNDNYEDEYNEESNLQQNQQNDNKNKNLSLKQENWGNNQEKQQDLQQKSEENQSIYQFNYKNQVDEIRIDWICYGQFYQPEEFQNVQIKLEITQEQKNQQLQNEIEKAAQQEKIKQSQFYNYAEGIKTIRLFKDKFQMIDLDSDEDEEEDDSTKIDSNVDGSKYKSTEIYSEFSSDSKSQNAIKILKYDNYQLQSVTYIKFIGFFLAIILGSLAFFDIILAETQFQENIDRINTVTLANKRVSDMQSILGFVRDLKMLSLGLYDSMYTEQEIKELEKEWKDSIIQDIILIRDIERELTLSPIKPSQEQNEMLTQPVIAMYFDEDNQVLLDGNEIEQSGTINSIINKEMYNLGDATRQILSYSHKVTTMELSKLNGDNSNIFFVETNMFQEYFQFTLESGQIYAQSLKDSNSAKYFNFLFIMIIVFVMLISVFFILMKLLKITQKNQEDIMILFLDVPEKMVKYMQTRASTFYYNLLQDKDEEVESFEKLAQDDTKDLQLCQNTSNSAKHKRKKYQYNDKIHLFFTLGVGTFFLIIQAYFGIQYGINVNLVSQFEGIITELNSTAIAEPFFFFAENLQRAAFINPQTFKPFGKDPAIEIKNNLLLTYELDSKIHTDHSYNQNIQLDSYKESFEAIMMVDACKILYDLKAVGSIQVCEEFASGIIKEGMASGISKYLDNIKQLNTVYNEFVQDPTKNFYKFAPQGTKLIDLFQDLGDDGLKQKCMSLLISEPSMQNREIQKNYLKFAFDYLKTSLEKSIQELVSSLNTTRFITIIFFMSLIIFVFLFLWLPFIYSLNRNLKKARNVLGLLPLSVILETNSIKTFIRKYVIQYQKRQYAN